VPAANARSPSTIGYDGNTLRFGSRYVEKSHAKHNRERAYVTVREEVGVSPEAPADTALHDRAKRSPRECRAKRAWSRFQVHEAVPSGEKPKLGPTKGMIPAHADSKTARKPPRIKLSGAVPGEIVRSGAL
jgi:hypothetical protein